MRRSVVSCLAHQFPDKARCAARGQEPVVKLFEAEVFSEPRFLLVTRRA